MVEHVLQIDSECAGSGGQTLLRAESRVWGGQAGVVPILQVAERG